MLLNQLIINNHFINGVLNCKTYTLDNFFHTIEQDIKYVFI